MGNVSNFIALATLVILAIHAPMKCFTSGPQGPAQGQHMMPQGQGQQGPGAHQQGMMQQQGMSA